MVHVIYESKISHIAKFSDTFTVDCENCRKLAVEDCSTNCEPQVTTYTLQHKYLIMK